MRRNLVLLVILIILVSALATACNKEEGSNSFTGVLESWNPEDDTIVVDGSTYRVTEGMKEHADKAEAGKTYEFIFDEHGNIAFINPK